MEIKKVMCLFISLTFVFCSLCLCDDNVCDIQQQVTGDNDGGFTDQQSSTSWTTGQQMVPTSQWENSWGQQPSGSSWGQSSGDSWGQSGNAGYAYTTQKPSDFGQLVEMQSTMPAYGQQMQPTGQSWSGPNSLWIVDVTGLNRYPSMSMPLYGYAREEITPSMEGYLTIEEMYPDGTVQTYPMGYVRPYQTYKMWFFADVAGTHLVRYSVNGYYSNTARFYVQGYSPSRISSTSSRSTTMSRGGSSFRSSSTKISTSGGSMSISTSTF